MLNNLEIRIEIDKIKRAIFDLGVRVNYLEYLNRFKQVPIGEFINSEDGMWARVVYGNGVYVSVAEGNTLAVYSGDGVNWYKSNLTTTRGIFTYAITFGNGLFVAGSDSINEVYYSYDGINWEQADTSNITTNNWHNLIYNNGMFIGIVSIPDGSDTNGIAYSTDGINWIDTGARMNNDTQDITYGNSTFVIWSGGIPEVMYSTNGKDWFNGTGYIKKWNMLAYGNNMFVASNDNYEFGYSKDGKIWYQGNYDGGGDDVRYTEIVYGNNKFVAVGNTASDKLSYFAYSTDGITWHKNNNTFNIRCYNIYYANNMFVGGLSDSSSEEPLPVYFIYSKDGITWNNGVMNGKWTNYGGRFAYGNNRFIICAENYPFFAHSDDGIHWTSSDIEYVG